MRENKLRLTYYRQELARTQQAFSSNQRFDVLRAACRETEGAGNRQGAREGDEGRERGAKTGEESLEERLEVQLANRITATYSDDQRQESGKGGKGTL